MPKTTFSLKDGTKVTIEGTSHEVTQLLDYYASRADRSVSDKPHKLPTEKAATSSEKPLEKTEYLQEIVKKVKSCKEAKAIESQILDSTSEVNRAILPLYIIYVYFDNGTGLTTTQISQITADLGIRISRQNVLRAVKFTGSRYIMAVKSKGASPRYKLNRRGVQYLKSVISGNADA